MLRHPGGVLTLGCVLAMVRRIVLVVPPLFGIKPDEESGAE